MSAYGTDPQSTSMNDISFRDLSLIDPILRAVEETGYKEPTEIQRAAIPEVLAGKDVLGTAQTGTGKTAAFSLPILQTLAERRTRRPRPVRALVLSPTRELAIQIEESFRTYGCHLPLQTAVLLGGVPMSKQIKALRRHPDIVVATPGRLLDLVGQGHVALNRVEVLVLDEADRMLDMGFINDVRKIVMQTPEQRQTLLFSATLSFAIADLASKMLKSPVHVEVAPAASVSSRIAQKVYFVAPDEKIDLLVHVLREQKLKRTLVFTRTKSQAEYVANYLVQAKLSADSIHSNKHQKARQRALDGFDAGKVDILVATDIVARGIDVEEISHVINYEMPNDAESYVHRIGRTARAGKEGKALSFCDAQDLSMLRAVEKLTQQKLEAVEDHPYHSANIAAVRDRRSATRRPGARRRFGGRRPRR